MAKTALNISISIILWLEVLTSFSIYSQVLPTSFSVSPSSVNLCEGCTDLTATTAGNTTQSYQVDQIPYEPYPFNEGNTTLDHIDDQWSSIIQLPFCFQFYGNVYNNIVIGSNQIVTFDLSQANQFCPYNLTNPSNLPSTQLPKNSIMAPYQDIDPTLVGQTFFSTTGTAPNRKFVISFYETPYFLCNSIQTTSQIVLHETTNFIDIIIKEKTTCSSWNQQRAIEGIQNAYGTQAKTVAGRNNTVWNAVNDAHRFTPNFAVQYSVTWFNENNTQIGTGSTINVCPGTSTYYVAKITGTDPCLGSYELTDTAFVNIIGIQELDFTSVPSSCTTTDGSASVQVIGGTSPYTFNWLPGNQSSSFINGLPEGSYAVTVTDEAGCTKTDSVAVGSLNTLQLSLTATTINCDAGFGTATVDVTGGTPAFTYAWENGTTGITTTSPTAGSIEVLVTDAIGCTKTGSVVIPEAAYPKLSIVSNSPLCEGESLNFSAENSAPDGSTLVYVWSGPDGFTASGQQVSINPVGLTDAGDYHVIGKQNGCPDTALTEVTVKPIPLADFTVDYEKGCSPHTVKFTDLSNPSGGILTWDFGDGTGENPESEHTYYGEGKKNVTLTTMVNGCSGKITKNEFIEIYPRAAANFRAHSPTTTNTFTTTIFDPSFIFENTSANASSFLWILAFGEQSTAFNTSQSYDAIPGMYDITLYANNANGCSDSITKTITIYEPMIYYVPNAFTPDGNSINGIFKPVITSGIDLSKYTMNIYNRWGEMIFTTNDYKYGWDGTVENSEIQDGTYVWEIYLKMKDTAEMKVVTGNVSLLR